MGHIDLRKKSGGSYVKNDIDLNKATNQIEIFDTGVAILAGKKTLHFNISGFAAYSRAVSAVIRFSLYRVNRPESIETKNHPLLVLIMIY